MRHWSILGTAFTTDEPGAVVEALRRAGFSSVRTSEIKRWGRRDAGFALHYAPERAPMFVSIEELVRDERDVNTGAWEMAEEQIQDPRILASLRCYADVRHYENADHSAVRAVVDFLMAENGGLHLFTWDTT